MSSFGIDEFLAIQEEKTPEKDEIVAVPKYVNSVLPELPEGYIEMLSYSLYSTEQIDNMSVLEITTPDELKSPKLGPHGSAKFCGTCDNSWSACPGHFGSMRIPRLIHPLLRAQVIYVLTCVCRSCGTLFLTKRELEMKRLLDYTGPDRLRKIYEFIKKEKERKREPLVCTNCSDFTPNRVYLSTEKNKNKVGILYQTELSNGSSVIAEETPEEIFKIFNAITNDDAELLGFKISLEQHPRRLIMNRLIVPPYCVRDDSRTGVGGLTAVYATILNKVKAYNRTSKGTANNFSALAKVYESVTALFKNDSVHTQANMQSDLASLITGKEGAARSHSQGKRVNNVARSVAAPGVTFSTADEHLIRVDEIGVPRFIADRLMRSLKVTAFNRDELQADMYNNKVKYIIMGSGPTKGVRIPFDRSFRNRHRNYKLQLGDEVVRTTKDGDYVIFHRSPTLEAGNILVLKARITNEKVIRPNVSVTTPMNLDFDGDETQIHMLNSPEAYAEAISLGSIPENLISFSTGRPIIALTYDALTGGYLMTRKDKIDPIVWQYSVQPLSGAIQMATYTDRLKKYGVEQYSGKGLFSTCLPEGFYYSKGGVVVRDGILTEGVLTKSQLGTTAGGFVSEMRRQFQDRQVVVDFISNARFIASRWLQVTGFTIHLNDCLPDSISDNALLIQHAFDDVRSRVINLTESFYDRKISEREDKNNERLILGLISDARNIQTRLVKDILDEDEDNNMLTTTKSGAKGTVYNTLMTMASLTQQTVAGERPHANLPGRRSLPSFQPRFTKSGEPIETRGFCVNNFGTGLEPEEFFFHMGSSREALVQGAKNTADTGAIERTAVKTCEDVSIGFFNEVSGPERMIQPMFGGDSFDPRESELIDGIRVPRNIVHLADMVSTKWEYM